MGVVVQDVAEHQRRLLEPGDVAQRRQVRLHDEVAIALRPACRLVAGHRLHIDVVGQQVVAAMRLLVARIRRRTSPGSACRSAGPACRRRRRARYRSRRPRRPSSTGRRRDFRPYAISLAPALNRRLVVVPVDCGAGRACLPAPGVAASSAVAVGRRRPSSCSALYFLKISTTLALARALRGDLVPELDRRVLDRLPLGVGDGRQLELAARCAKLRLAAPSTSAGGK